MPDGVSPMVVKAPPARMPSSSAVIVPAASFVIPVVMSSNGVTLTVTPYFFPNSLSTAGSM